MWLLLIPLCEESVKIRCQFISLYLPFYQPAWKMSHLKSKKARKKNVIYFVALGAIFLCFMLFLKRPEEEFSEDRSNFFINSSFPPSPIQVERIQTLINACRDYAVRGRDAAVIRPKKMLEKKIAKSKIRLDVLIGEPRGRLAYCHVPKVGSTAWMSVMARLNGFSDEQVEEMIKKGSLHLKMLELYNGNKNKTAQEVGFFYLDTKHIRDFKEQGSQHFFEKRKQPT